MSKKSKRKTWSGRKSSIAERGAKLSGAPSRILPQDHEAQLAVLNESAITLSPAAFRELVEAINRPPDHAPPAMRERLARKAPWERGG